MNVDVGVVEMSELVFREGGGEEGVCLAGTKGASPYM